MYKNIIFDLGNVILDIDTKLSEREFKKHGLNGFEKLYSLATQSKIFDKLEVGLLNEIEFYNEFRKITKYELSNETIKHCWNALIIDYTNERIEILKSVRKKHRTFILSNTNIIHYEFYTKLLKNKYGINNLNLLVDKVYLSHEQKLKKPDKRFYELVLNENKLNPKETLFIDDNELNINSAKQLGINTILLQNKKLEDLTQIR